MVSDVEVCATFSDNLKTLMARDNISQTELAKRCGCGISTVHNWVMGINVPRTGMLSALTKIFNCEVSDLLLSKKENRTLLDADMQAQDIQWLMSLSPEEFQDVRDYIEYKRAKREPHSSHQD